MKSLTIGFLLLLISTVISGSRQIAHELDEEQYEEWNMESCTLSAQNLSCSVKYQITKLSVQNFADWKVQSEPPPDVHIVFFSNQKLGYYSYNPPAGFTPEEILQFSGAKKALGTVEKVNELLELKEELGTLDVTGDDRWKLVN
ncbi:hypothetical protein C8J56DRAFT_898552 [Mycena floridula]|nr:hypothetical protein C8J56DRAFT_898552 [Mycena floridula]